MQPCDITDQLTQLHDSSLKELFETINSHKSALHDLVQQAHEELTALVGGAPAQQHEQVSSTHRHLLCAATGYCQDVRHCHCR